MAGGASESGHEPTYAARQIWKGSTFSYPREPFATSGALAEKLRGTRPTAFDLPNISEEFGIERGRRRTTGICQPSINDLVLQAMLTR
jgi:hypothetical protein